MLPEAYVTHNIVGRTRISIPSQKGNSVFFEKVRQTLSEKKELKQVKANATTGTLLLEHEGDFKTLEKMGEKETLFQLSPLVTHREVSARKRISRPLHIPLSEQISQFIDALDGRIEKKTDGTVDITTLMFTLLGAAGIYQVSKGNILPAGFTLITYALNLLSSRHFERRVESQT
jgi:hypothetical protein